MKIKLKSAYDDFKTGFCGKIFFISGSLLLFIYIFEKITHIFQFGEHILGIFLAFIILFFGVGLLVFFISCQFAKLSHIANDVENENSSLYPKE